MKRIFKYSGIIFLIGLIFLAVGYAFHGAQTVAWDHGFKIYEPVTNHTDIKQNVARININVSNYNVEIKSGKSTKVAFDGYKNHQPAVQIKQGTLFIAPTQSELNALLDKNTASQFTALYSQDNGFFFHFSPDKEVETLTVTLPKKTYDALNIRNTDGYLNLGYTNFKTINAIKEDGNLTFHRATTDGQVNLTNDRGNTRIIGSEKGIELSNQTGNNLVNNQNKPDHFKTSDPVLINATSSSGNLYVQH